MAKAANSAQTRHEQLAKKIARVIDPAAFSFGEGDDFTLPEARLNAALKVSALAKAEVIIAMMRA